MEFRILGPLEARSERGPLTLGGAKPRTVLAILLLHPNEPVSAERLALALWGEDAPREAVRTVHVHVSRLRKALGDPDVVATTPAGYCLRVGPDELDAARFERLAEEGRRVLAAGRPHEAAEALNQALTLWRGPALADLSYEAFVQEDIARLEDRRLGVLETRVAADLAAGRHEAVLRELQQLAAEHPTRERLAGHLMLALYRCGRQADALEMYATTRRALVDQVGVEPGPELRALQQAILTHDPALDLPASGDELPAQLDAAVAPPLVGREADVLWLEERWDRAQAGAGMLVAVTAPPGAGKTRLAAELATAVRRAGAAVMYATGSASPSLLAAIARVRDAARPTLLVVDDADRAGPVAVAALESLAASVSALPLLVLLTGEDAARLVSLDPESVVALEPLDVDAVREVARLYAPNHPARSAPAEWMHEASGGVPRRVHEIASQWSRREAARRVDTAASRAVAGRTELRSAETDLAGGVLELQAAAERVALLEDEPTVTCPFKGLASFEAADAPYFFGRETLVAELVAQLVGSPALALVGPSGSGKSSVLRAGLLPALADGVLPTSDRWAQAVMRPGAHPFEELTSAVAAVAGDEPGVLAIDQFEETFTVCRDEDERAAFVAELVRVARDARVTVVLAIRADCYGRCADHPALASLLAGHDVLVGAMRRDELRRAIERPALRAGLRTDEGLADTVVADVADQPGALPLLSTAMLELWQAREGRRLTLEAYERTGGVHGAVARLAERVFRRLDDRGRELARAVLLRLVEVDDEGAVERRRVALSELQGIDREAVSRVVDTLADGRLVTVSAGTVELAHEALMREWPRLASWIQEDRDSLRVHRRLRLAAQEWVRLGRPDDELYHGARLAETRERSDRDALALAEPEGEFLAASEARDRRERTAHRRRVGLAFAALTVALVAIAAVAIVAIHQRGQAEDQRSIARSGAIALQSAKALDADPGLALRLALWAMQTAPTNAADTAIRQALLADRQVGVLAADSVTAETAAYRPDGRRVVTGGDDGIARVWDPATRRVVASLRPGRSPVVAARWSPGGDRLALGLGDGRLLLTNGSLGAPRVLLRVPGTGVTGVSFSGDGRRVAASLADGTVRVLPAGGGPGRTLRAGGEGVPANDVDLDADGGRVVTAADDGGVRLFGGGAPADGRVLRAAGGAPENDVEFSPDGELVAGVDAEGKITLWDARTGAVARRLDGGGRPLQTAAFSANGRRLATAGSDGVIRVWSVAGGPPVAVLRGAGSRILDVGFGATGDRIVSAGDDGNGRLWDAGRDVAWVAQDRNWNIDLSPSGRFMVGGGQDGTARLWDATSGRLRASVRGAPGYVSTRFSPTSDTVLLGRDVPSNVWTWRVPSGHPVRVAQLPPHSGINVARYDATGRHIIYVAATGGIVVHDLPSGRDIRLGHVPDVVWDAEMSPDGKYVAAIPDRGDVMVWRLDRPARPMEILKGHRGDVNALEFSRDGRIATAGSDRTARIWSLHGAPPVVLRGHTDEVTTAVFTADGTRVLTSSQDGTMRVWDARTGREMVRLQSGRPVVDVLIARDGRIATLDVDQGVRIFRCDVCGSRASVLAAARARKLPPLSVAEKRRFLTSGG